jgi:homoserine acetyltransferase
VAASTAPGSRTGSPALGCAPVVARFGGNFGWHGMSWAVRPASRWWDDMVGPGKPLDTENFRVLGMDFLGGGSSIDGPVRGTDFPTISVFDQAECLVAVMDHCGSGNCTAAVGASLRRHGRHLGAR